MKRWAPGPKCSPRSSSNEITLTSSWSILSAGGVVGLSLHGIGPCLLWLSFLFSAALNLIPTALIVFVLLTRPAVIASMTHGCDVWALLVVLVVLVLFCRGVRALYGGEADETIRFMEPAVVNEAELAEPVVAQLSAAEQHYLDELESELRLLAQLPLVTAVNVFDKGDAMQQKGVLLSLDSRFLTRGKSRQIQVHCSEKEGWSRKLKEATQPKPTHLHAARAHWGGFHLRPWRARRGRSALPPRRQHSTCVTSSSLHIVSQPSHLSSSGRSQQGRRVPSCCVAAD
mmetsp:Transcript_18261/g.39244  ORF Transcript_18261/g.39244 Transcript_18261/m.39244 type:complete len:286 (-) Transcript_18261:60-917(-)